MSSLSLPPHHKGFFDAVSSGWGPFSMFTRKEERKEKKDLAKIALQEKAVTFEHQRILEHDQRQAAAMEELRAKIVSELRLIEEISIKTAKLMEEARKLAGTTILAGDPIVVELDKQAADMERVLVEIQTGTVADTATFDTNALAVSASDVRAALFAMRAIYARANGVLEAVRGRIAVLTKQREDRAARIREAEIAAKREAEQARADERRRSLDLQEAESRQASARRMGEMKRLSEINVEILRERRRLKAVQAEIVDLKSRRGLALSR